MSSIRSEFVSHVRAADQHLTKARLTADSPADRHIAAAQVHALLELAEAIASTSPNLSNVDH